MDFWPEFLASSSGREFVAGGFGGIAGIISGYPLDTLRIRLQNSKNGSAFTILRQMVSRDGPASLYRGMGAPLASVTFQVILVSFIKLCLCYFSLSFKSTYTLIKLQWNSRESDLRGCLS